MAIIKTGSSSPLPLDLATLPAAPLSGGTTSAAPAQAGFHLLFQGSLQAQGATALNTSDGKALPPTGELLPEGEVSGEAKGTSLLTSLEAAPAPIEGSSGKDGAESGGEVPSTLLTNQTPLQTGEPVQVVTPQETDAEGERPGPMSRPAEAAIPAQPAQPAVPPGQAASASAAQGVSVESGSRQGSSETSAVKSPTPAQPAVPPDQVAQAASMAQVGSRAQTAGETSRTDSAESSAGKSAAPAGPAVSATPAVPATSASVEPAPPLAGTDQALAPMPSGQVVTQAAVAAQTDNVDSDAQLQVAATGVTAAGATAAQTESGMPISEPAAGRVQPSNSERVVAESAVRASSAEIGGSQRAETPAANGRATLAGISTEVTDVTGRETAVPVASSRPEGTRLPVDMPVARQDAVAQAGLLQSGSDSGETADSGQQSRQDGQNAAAASALAARSGQGAMASSATTGPTFAQQLQQQLAEPRWGQQVGERAIMMAQHGPRTAHIQLDPPELGAMQIRVHLQGQDQVSVSFTSANPAVRDALEQQLPRLREMFADQGLNLQDSSVSDEARRQGSGQREQAEGFGRSGGYGSAEGPDAETLPAPAVALGLVDYYA